MEIPHFTKSNIAMLRNGMPPPTVTAVDESLFCQQITAPASVSPHLSIPSTKVCAQIRSWPSRLTTALIGSAPGNVQQMALPEEVIPQK